MRCKSRPKKHSSYADETDGWTESILLNGCGTHGFHAGAPSEKWVSDITEFKFPDTPKTYRSPVVDPLGDRPMIWAIPENPNTELANPSLLMACSRLVSDEHPFCHTDGGFHYRWPSWKLISEKHGVTRSISRKDRSPNNAACEGS